MDGKTTVNIIIIGNTVIKSCSKMNETIPKILRLNKILKDSELYIE